MSTHPLQLTRKMLELINQPSRQLFHGSKTQRVGAALWTFGTLEANFRKDMVLAYLDWENEPHGNHEP